MTAGKFGVSAEADVASNGMASAERTAVTVAMAVTIFPRRPSGFLSKGISLVKVRTCM